METLKIVNRYVQQRIINTTLNFYDSLQKSLSKEDDIKSKYERELQRAQSERLLLTNKLELALQERNRCVKERNDVIQERNALALQAQQEYERAERSATASNNY